MFSSRFAVAAAGRRFPCRHASGIAGCPRTAGDRTGPRRRASRAAGLRSGERPGPNISGLHGVGRRVFVFLRSGWGVPERGERMGERFNGQPLRG